MFPREQHRGSWGDGGCDRDGGLSCPRWVISPKQLDTGFFSRLFPFLLTAHLPPCYVSLILLQMGALSYIYTLTQRFVRAKEWICSAGERGGRGLHEKNSLKVGRAYAPACTELRSFVSKSKAVAQHYISNCPRKTRADTCPHSHTQTHTCADTTTGEDFSLWQCESKLKNRWDLCYSNGCRFLKCCQRWGQHALWKTAPC